MKVFLVVGLVVLNACAGRIPLPAEFKPADTAALLRRMPPAAVQAYSATLGLSYVGSQGIAKGSATLVVARPNRLRYDLHGPHGGVLTAFATDGRHLAFLDLQHGHFISAPALAQNIDALLNFAPLGLDAAGWVALLLGAPLVPSNAVLGYDSVHGALTLSFERSQVFVDPPTAQVVRIHGPDWDVFFRERDARGLPKKIEIHAPYARLTIIWQDVTYDAEPEPSVFVLTPPDGVEILQSEK